MSEIERTLAEANRRMSEIVAIEKVKRLAGDEAAYWFAAGIGTAWIVDTQYRATLRDIERQEMAQREVLNG